MERGNVNRAGLYHTAKPRAGAREEYEPDLGVNCEITSERPGRGGFFRSARPRSSKRPASSRRRSRPCSLWRQKQGRAGELPGPLNHQTYPFISAIFPIPLIKGYCGELPSIHPFLFPLQFYRNILRQYFQGFFPVVFSR